MTKMKLGTRTLDVRRLDIDSAFTFFSAPGLQKMLKGVDKKQKMAWDCRKPEGSKREPEPFPTDFPDGSSSFIIYANPGGANPNKDMFRRVAVEATRQFLRFVGYDGDPNGFLAAMGNQFGKHDSSFDVDKVIENAKTHKLDIGVRLTYQHFAFRHAKVADAVWVVLSLPDQVRILAIEEGECTKAGYLETPGGFF